MSDNQSIRVIACYARSGGTLLSRYLSQLENVLYFSEVNPAGEGVGRSDSVPTTLQDQAKVWHGIAVKSQSFTEAAMEISDHCRRKGSYLLIRDWSFINFDSLGESVPSMRLEILEAFAGRLIKPIAFLRDPIDVWISRGLPPLDGFLNSYGNYLREIKANQIPFVCYEDFCISPMETLSKMLDVLDIPFQKRGFDLSSASNITGDVQFVSRGNWRKKVAVLNRKRLQPERIRELEECRDDLSAMNEFFGYSSNYFDRKIESVWEVAQVKVARKIRNIVGISGLKKR